MTDRDIPTVPVTTLAGLTSLSDLLAELPLSETVPCLTSINKSLLFHPRVGEEANNLLNSRDDYLVRPLVQAIEQTNSDHIELKSQYAEQPSSGTNISELPVLLQAVHKLRPTVFKVGAQNQQYMVQQQQQNQELHRQHHLQEQSVATTSSSTQFFSEIQQHNILPMHSLAQLPISNINKSCSSISQAAWPMAGPSSQKSPKIIVHNQVIISPPQTHPVSSQQLNVIVSNYAQHEPVQPSYSASSIVEQPYVQQHQQFLHPQQLPILNPKQGVQTQSKHLPTNISQASLQNQSTLQHSEIANQPQNNTEHAQLHSQTSDKFDQVQQPPPISSMIISQSKETDSAINSMYGSPRDINQPLTHAQQGHLQQQIVQKAQQKINSQLNNITGYNHHNQKGPEGQSRNAHFHALINCKGPVDVAVEPTISVNTTVVNNNGISNHADVVSAKQNSTLSVPGSGKKTPPATTGPFQPVIQPNMSATDNEVANISIKAAKVCLVRLSEEDTVLMQKSLKKFASKSPEMARKCGIVLPEDESGSTDMFSQMKADERRTKRKPDGGDGDLELFSKPKLRKVVPRPNTNVSKSYKDDVVKSQTYQQFIRLMESEVRRLEESEDPNELDYTTDCIPSKILSQLTNDIAKLKAKRVIDLIPQNQLTMLITFAMRSVELAKNVSAGPDMEEEMMVEDAMDKILDAAEACLLVCNIYSATKDVKFLQEENMDQVVKFVQLQMRETIFPSFDSVYNIKSTSKVDKGQKTKKGSTGMRRGLQTLYTKLVELTKIFSKLFDTCSFIDTIVLAVSSLAIEPFFVDNIESMQFACLDLVATIFRNEKYSKYRSTILSDILVSVDRLPYSKKNLRPYKLSDNSGSIQMVTALVLQLIQCSTTLPETLCETSRKHKKNCHAMNSDESQTKLNADLILSDKYNVAASIGGQFLKTFLTKCKTKSSDTDFRPIFENFIYDLLATVNRPEWPASELLLSLLGMLLVKYVSDKSLDQSIRVVSLDYLGIVAARLRKDTIESRCKISTMDQLIKSIKHEQEKEGDFEARSGDVQLDPEEERVEFLQRILLDFLALHAHEDNLIWDYARHFYLTLWYRDIWQKKKSISEGAKGYASRKKKSQKRRRKYNKSDSESSESSPENDDSDDEEDKCKKAANDQQLNLEIFQMLEQRKKYLLNKIQPYSGSNIGTGSGIIGNVNTQDIRTYIDYTNAQLIAQYLTSKRSFNQSFDQYLQKIILVVAETSIAIRTKALKCLTMIVEVDPDILKRKDMRMSVGHKFLDTSISVREAAVDLVGKYALRSKDLIEQYYDLLSERILDTGVSVRKRVIKIMREICIEFPDFSKIPEICVKLIRRVNDEEGIQKLVTEVFMRMWFTPCAHNDKIAISRKINQMMDVVCMAHDTGAQWLDGLLKSIFSPKDEKDTTNQNAAKKEPPKEVVMACKQIADGLIHEIVQLESTNPQKFLGCIITLHLLAKVRPQLLIEHAINIEPYLNVSPSVVSMKSTSYVAEILEQVVPLIDNPSDGFLADLESHLTVLVVSQTQNVVTSALSCLGAIVNKKTKNYRLIRQCFLKYYKHVTWGRDVLNRAPDIPLKQIYVPPFRRGIFTVGLVCRYFDFKNAEVIGDASKDEDILPPKICDEVFEQLYYFATLNSIDIRKQSLIGLGHFCIKNYDYLTNMKLREFYCAILNTDNAYNDIKTIVLRNILMYLNDTEGSMTTSEKDWKKQSLKEDLKEMGDVSSGMASRIIQLYLKNVLACFVNSDFQVRLWAMKVVQAVLRQGLVHPVQIVPYLIALSTDPQVEAAHRADHHLSEIDKQYPGFVNMKGQAGIHLSFEFQTLLQVKESKDVVRGFSVKTDKVPSALNGFLYSLLRHNKPQRRSLAYTIIKQFEDQKLTLRQMLYVADNLAYFPYSVQDEPLYIIHQIDLFISTAGTNLLITFKENLKPIERNPDQPPNPLDDDDDDEDKDIIYNRLPENLTELYNCITSAQGCILLLMLKQHLKDFYGINDGKIARYSPSEAAKVYEKAMQRRNITSPFSPKTTIEIIKEEHIFGQEFIEKDKRDLIDRYLDFKQLMLKIDKEDDDSGSDRGGKVNPSPNKSGKDTSLFSSASDLNQSITNNTNTNSVATAVSSSLHKSKLVSHKSSAPTPNNRQQSTQESTPRSKLQSRKQPARAKRKKLKIVSSSDESDYSDGDYE